MYIHVKKEKKKKEIFLWTYYEKQNILYVYRYIDWVYILIGESIMERI